MDNQNELDMLNKIAGEYIEPSADRRVDRELMCFIVPDVLNSVNGPSVLEMGIGDDAWTSAVIERFGHSHIVDAAAPLVKRTKDKYSSRVTCDCSLFECYNPDRKYDDIMAFYILEHVDDPVLVLMQCKKWLKGNGRIHILVPHAGSLHRRLAVCMGLQERPEELGKSDNIIGHRRVYTIEAMEGDIKKAGLNIAKKSGYGCKLVPNSMMTSWNSDVLRGIAVLGSDLPIEYSSALYYQCTN